MANADEQAIAEFLASLEKEGMKITNKEGIALWFKGKLNKGFTLSEVEQKLKDYKYDFKTVDKVLDELSASKQESKGVMQKVEELEAKIGEEETKKKNQSQLNWIVSAFVVAIVSAGSSYFISKQVVGIDTSIMGETGGFLDNFIKAGWVIAIAAGFVGLLLITMFISEKYKGKKLISSGEQKPI